MRRVVVLNNYSFRRVTEEVRRGDKPAHHLYGIDRLPGLGFEVDDVPIEEGVGPWPRPVRRALELLPPVGNLKQQAAAIRRLGNADLIYAPCQTQTQLLSYLRAMGIVRVPMVILAHHPLARHGRRWKLPFLKLELVGTDAFPSLSSRVAREIGQISGRSELSEAIPWGPDLEYYPTPTGEPGRGAIAAGRTGRDFLTFAHAASAAGVEATVLCLRGERLSERASQLGPRVSIREVERETDLGYRELVPQLAAARVHAIPLVAGFSLSGLTSLTDALALGKPVIMTRHPLIDIDLEQENIGRWMEPGDVAGWAAALRWFEDHPDESAAMGRRARALAERRYNIDIFSRRMAVIFERTLARVPARS